MGYRGREIPVFDLTGGQASNRPVTGLEQNQALEVDNVHSLPGGGIALRQGDTEVNSTAFASGAAVTGLHWFKQADATKQLVLIANTAVGKIDYSGDDPDGTVDTVTGSTVITAGQNNLWFGFTAKDDAYFWGGPSSFDAPFKFDGTSTSAVSGSAPSGKFAFFHNNRIFVLTDSEVKHSTLTDITDFSGEGSGSAEIDADDGAKLMAAVPLNTDVVLLFKEHSIHQYITTTAPFPRFPLFRDTGAAGPGAVIVDEGVAYFITPQARMKATDGSKVVDFPPDMDDEWDAISKTRLPFIRGYVEQGKNFRHIKWVVTGTGGSSNDKVFIWDLDKKSWWKYAKGHDINAVTHDRDTDTIYTGHYDGKIYKKNVTDTYTDASESGAGIKGFWRWGWQTNNSFQISVHPQRLNISLLAQTVTAIMQVQYGFDFIKDLRTEDVDSTGVGGTWDIDLWDTGIWGGQTDIIKNILLFGRGNAFNIKFSNKSAGQPFQLNGFTLSGKQEGQKEFATQ